MLILTRKPGESLYIGDNIKITIVELKGHQIRVGIDAPAELRIYREEIYLQILEENKKAAEASLATDAGLESLSKAWSARHRPASVGPRATGGDDDEASEDEAASAPTKAQVPAFSTFFTARAREGGPQVVVKRKRSRRTMSDESTQGGKTVIVQSTRFGELTVPVESLFEIPSGLIGFPRHTTFIMLEHKPPFSWLHSVQDPNLAFVVVDGFQFGEPYPPAPPFHDKDANLEEGDDYAILVVVTVRPDPQTTTANLKAPLFVNMRNRKGVQIIIDDQRFSTRFPLWSETQGANETTAGPAGESASKEEPSK